MCKPWKDGGFSRKNAVFESWSSHVRRMSADEAADSDKEQGNDEA
jgi:hypothetical protein